MPPPILTRQNMMEHSDSNPSEPSDSDDDHGEQWMTVPSLEQQRGGGG